MSTTLTQPKVPPATNPYAPAGEPSHITIRPLATPFGAELTGIDWDHGFEGIVEELTRALRRHLLLIFQGQRSPTHDEVNRFFAPFGRETLQQVFVDNGTRLMPD